MRWEARRPDVVELLPHDLVLEDGEGDIADDIATEVVRTEVDATDFFYKNNQLLTKIWFSRFDRGCKRLRLSFLLSVVVSQDPLVSLRRVSA